ncbi:MAG: phage tail protein, partial [Hungatella sp.]
NRVITFTGFTRKASARTAVHSIINNKPQLEYLGLDLQSITFKMELNAMLGIRPRREEEKLLKAIGKVAPLVIGGKKICSNAMLTDMSDVYDIVMKKGEVLSMSIDITMSEYR